MYKVLNCRFYLFFEFIVFFKRIELCNSGYSCDKDFCIISGNFEDDFFSVLKMRKRSMVS